ncbi:hypothetical protein B0J11DRAFT_304155 [Dendryphion nanum]|uniref:Uncharacterized protein n=1 Tax=Dendryphion nanum TaxID=256645 RepID=A0A9P9DRH6_9PLEO|nr:hypothetical protein B0J11DRAFT_304155 [Dendryphion nanum]
MGISEGVRRQQLQSYTIFCRLSPARLLLLPVDHCHSPPSSSKLILLLKQFLIMSRESRYGFSLPSVIWRSRTHANLRGASQAPLAPYHSNATDTALPLYRNHLQSQHVDRVDDSITALPLSPPPSPPPTPPSPPVPKKLKKKQSVSVFKKGPRGKSKVPPRTKTPSTWSRFATRCKRNFKSLAWKKRGGSGSGGGEGSGIRKLEIGGPFDFRHVGGVEVLQDSLRQQQPPAPQVVAVIQQQEVSPTDSDDEYNSESEFEEESQWEDIDDYPFRRI